MKAAIVEENNQIVIRDIPEPELPNDYAVLCDTVYGSMCAGTDSHLVRGDEPFCQWIPKPFILGHESVGRVIRLGSKVRHVKAGDLITRVGCPPVGEINSGWGGFCEKTIAYDYKAMQEDGVDPGEGIKNRVLPSAVDAADATLFITWRETFSYMKRMGVKQDAQVLIIGSGGNGLAFTSHAQNLGATTIVMVGSALREDDSIKAGATHFIDYKAVDAKAQADAIAPDGFDFAIDVLGSPQCTNLALSLLADGGCFGNYGFDCGSGDTELDKSLARGRFTIKDKSYDEAEVHDEVLQFYLDGKLDPNVLLKKDQTFTLDQINDAYAAVQDRSLVKPLVKIWER